MGCNASKGNVDIVCFSDGDGTSYKFKVLDGQLQLYVNNAACRVVRLLEYNPGPMSELCINRNNDLVKIVGGCVDENVPVIAALTKLTNAKWAGVPFSATVEKAPARGTLYIKPKELGSLKVLIFLSDAKLMDAIELVEETNIPEKVQKEITSKFAAEIQALDEVGKTWLPCFKDEAGYVLDEDKIVDALATKNGVDKGSLRTFHLFQHGVFKDYRLLQSECNRLAHGGSNAVGDAEAWFKSLDTDGDMDVSLEEMIQGLDLTRLMAQARRGAEVFTKFDRFQIANEQIDALVKTKPDLVNAWRLRLLLGTISDDYDKIIDSADKIIGLSSSDAQALTLKAFYCKALSRLGFDEAVSALQTHQPDIAEAATKLIASVNKYWEAKLSHDVPKGITEKMSIVALGSPADDDGTPRPRLLGTLNKTLEAAKAYPDADIFVTGAAVSSNMPEAIAMTKWLTARGVDEKRITKEMKAMDTVGNYEYIAPMLKKRGITKVMLITVYYHLNRSAALADAVFEQRGLAAEVVGVAGESDLKGDDLSKRMDVERPASYRDVARACCLYEHSDFELQCKHGVHTN